jgi:hypothetical protein
MIKITTMLLMWKIFKFLLRMSVLSGLGGLSERVSALQEEVSALKARADSSPDVAFDSGWLHNRVNVLQNRLGELERRQQNINSLTEWNHNDENDNGSGSAHAGCWRDTNSYFSVC